MRLLRHSASLALLLSALTPVAWARLGETEAQSAARYGAPSPELITAADQPLLAGAKELAYQSGGWRIRAAYVNGAAIRVEYIKIPDAAGLKKITDDEVQTVLQAEKGTFSWREEKPRTGNNYLNKLATAIGGRNWERSDHALAHFRLGLVLVVESRLADDWERKQGKSAGKPTAPPAGPRPNF